MGGDAGIASDETRVATRNNVVYAHRQRCSSAADGTGKDPRVHTIAVAGHICVDLTPELSAAVELAPGHLFEVGPLSFRVGGCVANTARALGDLGAAVHADGLIGDDELGRYITRAVTEMPGVIARLATHPGRPTSYSLVLERPGSDRTFWHHTGVNDDFDGRTVDLDVDLLHLGYPSLLPRLLENGAVPLVDLLTRARQAGLTTSVDLAVVDPDSAVGALDWSRILQRVLPLVDVISPSMDDLVSALRLPDSGSPELVQVWADRLVEWGAGVAAISAGAAGLRLRAGSAQRLAQGGRVLAPLAQRWADAAVWRRPRPVESVTTNGAGDACTAGLLFALTRGADPELAAQLAIEVAGEVVSGHRPSPDRMVALIPAARPVFGPEPPAA